MVCFRGVVCSKDWYNGIGCSLKPRIVFTTFDKRNLDRLWRSIESRRHLFVICVNPPDHVKETLSRFSFDHVGDNVTLSDFLSRNLSGNRLRKKWCSEIRKKLLNKFDIILGPEMETISLLPEYGTNARMIGLYENYTVFSNSGGRIREFYEDGSPLLRQANAFSKKYDPGQCKLGCVFSAFASHREIVYIGSEPGDTWREISAERKIHVIPFDPKIGRTYNGRSDLPDGDFDLFWDVRCEYVSDEQYERVRTHENDMIADLIRSPWVAKRMCFKIALNSGNLPREIPSCYRLFRQPFYEGRALGREVRMILECDCATVSIDWDEVSKWYDSSATETSLIISLGFMRMEFRNFLECDLDGGILGLFCLSNSRNSLAKINDLLKTPNTLACFPITSISEEVSKELFRDHGLDSLSFDIPRCSFSSFLSSNGVAHVEEEWMRNWCFVGSSSLITSDLRLPTRYLDLCSYWITVENVPYDDIRNKVCSDVGKVMYSHYSMRGNLSVSGHMAKLVAYSDVLPLDLWFYVGYITSHIGCLNSKFIRSTPRRERVGWENEPKTLWHSRDEWLSGIEAGRRILEFRGKGSHTWRLSLLESFLKKEIRTGQLGHEVYLSRKIKPLKWAVVAHPLCGKTTVVAQVKGVTDIDEYFKRVHMFDLMVEDNFVFNDRWTERFNDAMALLRADNRSVVLFHDLSQARSCGYEIITQVYLSDTLFSQRVAAISTSEPSVIHRIKMATQIRDEALSRSGLELCSDGDLLNIVKAGLLDEE
nr:MAG: hypothetical protein [brine shrimp orbivirus 2]